jgi:flagellar hook-associated protein 2
MGNLRIGGLATGMDTDTIIKDLMKVQRMPMEKLKQKKQILEWQRDDYRAMNTLLLDFRSKLTAMKYTSQYRARVTASTNDTLVTATATSAAGQSSHTISSVRQLASSERLLNGGSVTLDPVKGIYEQTKADPGITWSQGSVESKTITADGTQNFVSLGVPVGELKDFNSWGIKVNGTSYKVVDQTTFNSGATTDKVVYIDSTGQLNFKQNLTANSSVHVDYIAARRKDTLSLSSNTSSVQLTRGSVDSIYSFDSADPTKQIKLTRRTKDATTDVTEPEVFFQVVNGKVLDTDGTELGSLNKETGLVTFDNAVMKTKGYLPPDPPEVGKEYFYNIEVEYDQNYTSFKTETEGSKGTNYENFIVQGNESVNSILTRVSASDADVTMFFDSFTGQMTMSRNETGKFNLNPDGTSAGPDIATSGDLINNIFKFATGTITEGQNAKFTINGIDTERSSNTFEFSGVTFTLKQTFNEDPATATAPSVSINVNNDSSKVFDNIVQFVAKYNDLIAQIQKKTGEERYKSYTPLTDEQREQLSDKQQESWEEKAKSGLIRRDPIFTGALSEMRVNFYQPVLNDEVSSIYNQLAQIGIKTTSNYMEGGKLEIDEAALKKAIDEDPKSVEALFIGEGTTTEQKGIIHRLYDTVNNTIDKVRKKAGASYNANTQFSIGLQINDFNSRITSFEDRLQMIEDRYWRQFTAMEKAIQTANSQSMFMMQQFGGGM